MIAIHERKRHNCGFLQWMSDLDLAIRRSRLPGSALPLAIETIGGCVCSFYVVAGIRLFVLQNFNRQSWV